MDVASKEKIRDLVATGQVYQVDARLTVAGRDIEPKGLSLRIAERGEDSLTLEADTPGSLDIDPRERPEVRLSVKLIFPDHGVESVTEAWTLTLREVTYSRSAKEDTTHIIAQGLEALIRDDNGRANRTFTRSDALNRAIEAILRSVIPAVPVISQGNMSMPFVATGDTLTWEPTTNAWALITTMCDGTGENIECFWDGNSFQIRSRPGIGAPKYQFHDGETSNIESYEITVARQDFYNATRVRFSNGATGEWEQTKGALSVQSVGRRLYSEDIPIDGTVPSAATRAAALGRRLSASGRTATLKSPDTPLDLRPGDTVETYIDNSTEKWIIQGITFTLPGGVNLELRKEI